MSPRTGCAGAKEVPACSLIHHHTSIPGERAKHPECTQRGGFGLSPPVLSQLLDGEATLLLRWQRAEPEDGGTTAVMLLISMVLG